MESRRIFRKLKSYVTYRFAASMQIVIVLTLLIYISNCPIDSVSKSEQNTPISAIDFTLIHLRYFEIYLSSVFLSPLFNLSIQLYIILLALFNDLTMLPIAYDRQQASAMPETPDVNKMIILSALLGVMETGFTLLWAYVSDQTGFFQSDFKISECGRQAQAGVWVQMSIAAELLIFSARAPSFIFVSVPPSVALFSSVIFGCFLFSLFAAVIPYFGYLHINDIIIIWAYDIICLFFIDCVKVAYLKATNESTDVLPELTPEEKTDEEEEEVEAEGDVETGPVAAKPIRKDSIDDDSRAISVTRRLSNWSETKGGVDTSSMRKSSDVNIVMATGRKPSSVALIAAKRGASTTNVRRNDSAATITVARGNSSLGSSTGLRGSSASLRPATPSNAIISRGIASQKQK